MTIDYTKDCDAVLDYAYDWSSWLATGETISSHTVVAPSGLTVDSSSESNGVVTAWLSGGTTGTIYNVSCKIVTSAGRTDARRIRIQVKCR